jgi:hypothetical protein
VLLLCWILCPGFRARKQLKAKLPSDSGGSDKPRPTTEELDAQVDHLMDLLAAARSGRRVRTHQVESLAPLFREVITLPKLSRKQLVRLAKFFNILPYLSDDAIRRQLTRKIRSA